MDDEFFDPIDSELRRRFDAAAPRTAGDPDAVLDSLRPQMRKARTRHRAVIAGSVVGAFALIAVAGAALTGGTSNPNVNTPPASHSSTPRPTMPDVTIPVAPTPPPGEIKQEGTNGGGALNDTATTEGTSGGSSSGSGSSGGGETTPTTPAPQSQTFPSAGGSITVTLADGSLSLTATTPAAGQYAQVNKSSGNEIEVEFFSNPEHTGKRTSRIRVDLVNGAMQSSVD